MNKLLINTCILFALLTILCVRPYKIPLETYVGPSSSTECNQLQVTSFVPPRPSTTLSETPSRQVGTLEDTGWSNGEEEPLLIPETDSGGKRIRLGNCAVGYVQKSFMKGNRQSFDPQDPNNTNWAIEVLERTATKLVIRIICKDRSQNCSAINSNICNGNCSSFAPESFYIIPNHSNPRCITGYDSFRNKYSTSTGLKAFRYTDYDSYRADRSSDRSGSKTLEAHAGNFNNHQSPDPYVLKFSKNQDPLSVGNIIVIEALDGYINQRSDLSTCTTNDGNTLWYSFMTADRTSDYEHSWCPLQSLRV